MEPIKEIEEYIKSPAVLERYIRTVVENPFIPKMDGKFPSAKQRLLLMMPHREIYYAGDAGGGKTAGLLAAALQHVDHPRYVGVIFGKTLAAMEKSDRIIQQSHQWLDGTKAKWNAKYHRWHFPSGARISFEPINSMKAVEDVVGTGMSFAGIEEVHYTPSQRYTFLNRSLRGVPGIPRRLFSNSNPGGPFQKFYVERFIEKPGPDQLWIESITEDNPGIDTQEYRTMAESSLDPVTRARQFHRNFWIQDAGNLFRMADSFERISTWDRSRIVESVRGWDIAATAPTYENPNPDYAAGVLIHRIGPAEYVVVNMVALQGTPKDLEDEMKRCAERDGYETRINIEHQPAAAGKIMDAHFLDNVLPDYDLTFSPTSGTKLDRWRPVAAAVERGWVRFSTDPSLHPLLDQMQVVNGSKAEKNDFVDALATAFNAMNAPDVGLDELPPLPLEYQNDYPFGEPGTPFTGFPDGANNDEDWQ
jgi:phage terminase large subunit-like protein